MEEEWGVIDGFPRYIVSTYGQVHNWMYNRPVKLRPKSNGHITVELQKEANGKSFTKMVSRLVIETFFVPSDLVVRHVNGDVTDNRISNLRFATRSEIQQQIVHRPDPKRQCKRVRAVETGEIFPSVKACSLAFGLTRSAISYLLTNKRRSAAGFTFEYVDED
jgi:hypothetical protein